MSVLVWGFSVMALRFSFFISFLVLTLRAGSSLAMADRVYDVPVLGQKCAILLHGLARTSKSMRTLQWALEKEGYVVWNKTYPSTEKRIEELALVIDDAMAFCKQRQTNGVYFVTHSMGGILVRQYFQHRSAQDVEAVVMLAPPNHGSEIVDAHGDSWWFQLYHGPAGSQLGTDPESLPHQLQPIDIPIGVIAGTVSSDPWFGYLFDGPYDGKVSVESARLDEMRDFLTVERGHTMIMNSDEVIEQVLYFFQKRNFKR